MNGLDVAAVAGLLACAWFHWLEPDDEPLPEPPLESIEEAKERAHYFPDEEEPYDWEADDD